MDKTLEHATMEFAKDFKRTMNSGQEQINKPEKLFKSLKTLHNKIDELENLVLRIEEGIVPQIRSEDKVPLPKSEPPLSLRVLLETAPNDIMDAGARIQNLKERLVNALF